MAKRSNHRRNQRHDDKPKYRINFLIRVPEIRLVGDNLEEVSKAAGREVTSDIYSTKMVLDWADKMNLDLVEISPKAAPPVCRIIDYKKFLYQKKKKDKELRAKAVKTVVKEIRFGPNMGEHDFEFKLRHARGFLEEGAKVKCYVHFRGRTIVFKDRGELLLLRFIKELEELGAPEAMPKMEGRRMIVIISPKKVAKTKSKSKSKKEAKPEE